MIDHEFDDDVVQKLWDDTLETASVEGLSPNELDRLVHVLFCRRLIEKLQQPDPSPGTLQCALRFMKDNDIAALPVPGSANETLLSEIREKLPFPKIADG